MIEFNFEKGLYRAAVKTSYTDWDKSTKSVKSKWFKFNPDPPEPVVDGILFDIPVQTSTVGEYDMIKVGFTNELIPYYIDSNNQRVMGTSADIGEELDIMLEYYDSSLGQMISIPSGLKSRLLTIEVDVNNYRSIYIITGTSIVDSEFINLHDTELDYTIYSDQNYYVTGYDYLPVAKVRDYGYSPYNAYCVYIDADLKYTQLRLDGNNTDLYLSTIGVTFGPNSDLIHQDITEMFRDVGYYGAKETFLDFSKVSWNKMFQMTNGTFRLPLLTTDWGTYNGTDGDGNLEAVYRFPVNTPTNNGIHITAYDENGNSYTTIPTGGIKLSNKYSSFANYKNIDEIARNIDYNNHIQTASNRSNNISFVNAIAPTLSSYYGTDYNLRGGSVPNTYYIVRDSDEFKGYMDVSQTTPNNKTLAIPINITGYRIKAIRFKAKCEQTADTTHHNYVESMLEIVKIENNTASQMCAISVFKTPCGDYPSGAVHDYEFEIPNNDNDYHTYEYILPSPVDASYINIGFGDSFWQYKEIEFDLVEYIIPIPDYKFDLFYSSVDSY